MRKILLIKNTSLLAPMFVAAITLLLISCKKDTDGSPDIKPGNLQFTSVTPGEAAGGTVLTLRGSGLGSIVGIVFDLNNSPATITPTLNTDDAIIFRVPDTAAVGPQNIVLTNSAGRTLQVPFTVLGLPKISAASTFDFLEGTEITLTGVNLDDVTKVVFHGTTTEITIVSKTATQLVLNMPASTANRTTLDITNKAGTSITVQEFTYIPNAFQVFTEGFVDGMQDWSWCKTHDISNTESFMGTLSLRGVYGAGSWGAISLHKNDPKLACNLYKFLTFWVKGGTADTKIDVYSEQKSSAKVKITVPANVWTYYKLPITGWIDDVQLERLDFQMNGPDGEDQTLYFDNILFVK